MRVWRTVKGTAVKKYHVRAIWVRWFSRRINVMVTDVCFGVATTGSGLVSTTVETEYEEGMKAVL